MKILHIEKLFGALAFAAAFTFTTTANAQPWKGPPGGSGLAAPQNVEVECNEETGMLVVSWDAVDGANHYSAEVVAFYTIGEETIAMTFDYGSQALSVAFCTSDFIIDRIIDEGEETEEIIPVSPDSADVAVKALRRGNRAAGDSPFSEAVELPLDCECIAEEEEEEV